MSRRLKFNTLITSYPAFPENPKLYVVSCLKKYNDILSDPRWQTREVAAPSGPNIDPAEIDPVWGPEARIALGGDPREQRSADRVNLPKLGRPRTPRWRTREVAAPSGPNIDPAEIDPVWGPKARIALGGDPRAQRGADRVNLPKWGRPQTVSAKRPDRRTKHEPGVRRTCVGRDPTVEPRERGEWREAIGASLEAGRELQRPSHPTCRRTHYLPYKVVRARAGRAQRVRGRRCGLTERSRAG
ncbi:hypothetical protein NDU88_006793 [Pleurodeles waltl]|uniref:Uncharacterized protein n=1 Tax=Pleurodeles waltl TaxID=8319 RepID=A0AAV7SQX6_PLEWA|nr:hypothetical protein NDU88_006793 [Pleurodeles waltl]